MKKRWIVLTCVIGIILLTLLILYHDQRVAVLGYHAFATPSELDSREEVDNLIMNVEHFEDQLKYLKKHHYKTLSLEEFYCFMKGTCKIPRKSVLITMDDGYQSNYELAFPLLKKYNMKAVVFCIGENTIGDYPNYMDLDTIKKAQREYPNITFASHSYQLHGAGSIDKGREYLEEDFKKMKEIISTQYFAYPYGASNEEIKQVLKKEHFKLAFGFGPGKEHRKAKKSDDLYKIPRLNISNDMPLWKFKLRLMLPF